MTNKVSELIMLTDKGLVQFQNCLVEHNQNKNFTLLSARLNQILTSPDFSYPCDIQFHFKIWTNRRELAEDLWLILGKGKSARKFVGSRLFWSGLSVQYLVWLIENGTTFNVGESARWLPDPSSLRRHRHLLQGPFVAYEENIEDVDGAMSILASDPLTPGEVVERVAGKANFMRGAGVKLATRLYFDPATNKLKSGVSSHGPGSPRRLSYYLTQIDLTIDYYSMSVDELINILPREFQKWLRP